MKNEIIEILDQLIEDSRTKWCSPSDEVLAIEVCAEKIEYLKE